MIGKIEQAFLDAKKTGKPVEINGFIIAPDVDGEPSLFPKELFVKHRVLHSPRLVDTALAYAFPKGTASDVDDAKQELRQAPPKDAAYFNHGRWCVNPKRLSHLLRKALLKRESGSEGLADREPAAQAEDREAFYQAWEALEASTEAELKVKALVGDILAGQRQVSKVSQRALARELGMSFETFRAAFSRLRKKIS